MLTETDAEIFQVASLILSFGYHSSRRYSIGKFVVFYLLVSVPFQPINFELKNHAISVHKRFSRVNEQYRLRYTTHSNKVELFPSCVISLVQYMSEHE